MSDSLKGQLKKAQLGVFRRHCNKQPSPKEFPPEIQSVNMHHNSFMVSLSSSITGERQDLGFRKLARSARSLGGTLTEGHVPKAFQRSSGGVLLPGIAAP